MKKSTVALVGWAAYLFFYVVLLFLDRRDFAIMYFIVAHVFLGAGWVLQKLEEKE